MIRHFFYRKFMEFAHRFNWHYAPEIGPISPDGSMQKWCQWCGFRQSYPPRGARTAAGIEEADGGNYNMRKAFDEIEQFNKQRQPSGAENP